MKKLFYGIVLISMFIPSLVAAQVKSYVGVVRQQYYSEYVDMFKKMSKELKDEGYNTYSKSIDAYLEGGFGSGFVYVAPDGTNYIITNRHVIAQAETASVEFEDDATGELTKYEGLKVVATDDDIDIAILAFKDGEKPFKKGLALSDKTLSDGQEVWSAGFPGLGNDPVWQFGKGTVTNARARIKELLAPEVSTIIQHSAQVDSGNSGGPLLIASGKDYVVVGINTWKAAYRDSTNFAIPSAVIKQMIDSLSTSKTSSAEDRAFKLAQVLGDSSQNFTAIVNFISFHKASVDGQADLETVLRFAPTSARSQVSDVFSYNPAEGLRYACAYQLFKKYGSTEDKTYSYKTEVTESSDEKMKITFTSGDDENAKTFETQWIKEHGLWRLDVTEVKEDEADSDKKDKSKKKDTKKDEKSSNSGISFEGIDAFDHMWLKVGMMLPRDEGVDKTFGGEMILFAEPALGLGFGIYKVPFLNETKIGMQSEIVLRLPLYFNKFEISPFAQGGFSIVGMGTPKFQTAWHYEFGLQTCFDTAWGFYPGLGVSYKVLNYKKFLSDDIEAKYSSILVFVTIGF